MDELNLIIGHRVRDWRREFEVTQSTLADAVGVSRQSIISLEAGKCLPSISLALSLAKYFQHPLDQLLVFDIEKNQNQNEEDLMDRQIRPLRHTFERALDDVSVPFGRGFEHLLVPQMNIYQTEGEIVVEADVPGMTENDVDIEIRDGVLTIRGERKEEQEEKQKEYFHREVSYGAFQRAVTLPTDVIPEKATAEVKKGQLKVVLPKVKPVEAKGHELKSKGE